MRNILKQQQKRDLKRGKSEDLQYLTPKRKQVGGVKSSATAVSRLKSSSSRRQTPQYQKSNTQITESSFKRKLSIRQDHQLKP